MEKKINMGNDCDDSQAPGPAASFDWGEPLQNGVAGEDGMGDSIDSLSFQSLKDVDSAAWLATSGNSTFDSSGGGSTQNESPGDKFIDEKLSPADRFIDDFPPVSKRKKRKHKQQAQNQDPVAPLYAASQGKRKKKPSGMPKRALSAYNCYFQEERARLIQNGQVEEGPNRFEQLGKLIGRKWRSLPEEEKKRFYDLATADQARYHRQMEAWRAKQKDPMQKNKKATTSPLSSPPLSDIDPAGKAEEPSQAVAEREKGSDLEITSFAALESPALDTADIQSQESFARAPYSPFTSPSPSMHGAEMMNSQDMAHRNGNSMSVAETPMDNEAPQGQAGYADAMFSREPPAYPQVQRDMFAAHHAPHPRQHEQTPPMHHPYNAQGEFIGFPSESIGAPPGFMLAGMPRRVQDPPPNAAPVPPGMEIVLPDQNGVQQKYKVQYACYLVTREEAKEYVEKFGDCPLRMGPPPVLNNGTRPMRYVHRGCYCCFELFVGRILTTLLCFSNIQR